MEDRELIEAAAKAAGLRVLTRQQAERDSFIGRENASLWIVGGSTAWNPLTDDGDALRLAVKLRLDICRPEAEHGGVCVWVDALGDFIEEPHGSNAYAATRRAIVRAAAAMCPREPHNAQAEQAPTARGNP